MTTLLTILGTPPTLYNYKRRAPKSQISSTIDIRLETVRSVISPGANLKCHLTNTSDASTQGLVQRTMEAPATCTLSNALMLTG